VEESKSSAPRPDGSPRASVTGEGGRQAPGAGAGPDRLKDSVPEVPALALGVLAEDVLGNEDAMDLVRPVGDPQRPGA